MSSIAQKRAALGLQSPPPMQTPPGMVLPFAFVGVVGRRALASGHGPAAASRSAVGLAGLPFDVPVEIEAEVELRV
jgi:hypothetical protein